MQTDDEARVFGDGFERCPRTNRPYERGIGALSKERQTENFVREAAYFADMPKPGEYCLQTGREYDCSSGAPMKSAQSEQFLRELSPEQKAKRQADFEAFAALPAKGKA